MPEFTLMQCATEASEAMVHPAGRIVLASHPTPGDFLQMLPNGAAEDAVFEVLAVLLNGMRDGLEIEDVLYVRRLGGAEEWHATIATELLAR